MDDELLAGLDWVMASIHSGFDAPRDELTKRLMAAMENPNVDCIGHPTGRKLNRRAPYDLDLDAVFAAAVETGTFLEINAQPDRLDLRDSHARAAAEAGREDRRLDRRPPRPRAGRTSSSASSRPGAAGSRKDDVVNTRTWAQVKKLMKS